MMTTLANPARWLIDFFTGTKEGSTAVTPQTAMKLSTVWYAHNLICGHIAQMPLDCLKRLPKQGATQAKEHPSFSLVRSQPNAYQTADVFKENIQSHALMWGNGRAAIIRSANQRLTELIPLMPDRTLSYLIQGEKYHVTLPTADERLLVYKTPGQYRNLLEDMMLTNKDKTVVLHDRDVLHIIGFGFDGVEGMRLFDVARDSWSIGLNSQRLAKTQAGQGFAGKLMLEAPAGALRKEDEALEFLRNFEKRHEAGQDGKIVGLLREGVKATVLNMTNQDAQFIESRKFDRQEVMLWFGLESVPGDDTPDSYSARVEKNLAYLVNCLNRWLVKWEMQCNTKLLTEVEKRTDSHFFKFNTAALLRSNLKDTATIIGNLVTHKILNSDEGRDLLDLPPRGDGMGHVYENPAIAIAQTQEPNREDRKATAAQLQLTNLLRNEGKKAIACCKSDNFVTAITDAYVKWEPKFRTYCEALGLDDDKEVAKCRERQSKLIEISGQVSSEADLLIEVTKYTESWLKD